MNVHTGRVIVAAIVVTLLSACGNSNNDSKEAPVPAATASLSPTLTASAPAATTAPAPNAAPFNATVYISDDFPGERWLPTQFAPRLVSGESVSLFSKWPLDGDRVRVLCQTTGEPLQDIDRVPTDLWYGIVVPAEKATHEAHDGQGSEAQTFKGDFVGFVPSYGLADVVGVAPPC